MNVIDHRPMDLVYVNAARLGEFQRQSDRQAEQQAIGFPGVAPNWALRAPLVNPIFTQHISVAAIENYLWDTSGYVGNRGNVRECARFIVNHPCIWVAGPGNNNNNAAQTARRVNNNPNHIVFHCSSYNATQQYGDNALVVFFAAALPPPLNAVVNPAIEGHVLALGLHINPLHAVGNTYNLFWTNPQFQLNQWSTVAWRPDSNPQLAADGYGRCQISIN